MRASAAPGRLLLLVMAAGAACSLEATGDPEAMGGDGGVGGASGGKGGSATGSGGTSEPSTGGSEAGGSSVGGGRGVVGGAAGMGAYGGKPPIGSAGANVGGSGLAAAGGTGAEGGSGRGAESATGGTGAMGGGAGTEAPGTGGTPPTTGGNAGAGGVIIAAGGTMNEAGGNAGTGGSASQTGGAGGAGGGSGKGGTSATGGTGGMTPVGGCNNELLVNAGFESGKGVGWEEMSDWPGIELVVNGDDAALAAEGVSPYAGSFLAWLGGIPDNEWDHNVTLIQQRIVIPATASSLTLSGRHLVKSVDDPSAEYDEAYLEFDLDDSVVWQSLRLTNLSASSDWVSFMKTTNDVENLSGKTLLFYAYARTDLTGRTSFFLDSLSLIASCGR